MKPFDALIKTFILMAFFGIFYAICAGIVFLGEQYGPGGMFAGLGGLFFLIVFVILCSD